VLSSVRNALVKSAFCRHVRLRRTFKFMSCEFLIHIVSGCGQNENIHLEIPSHPTCTSRYRLRHAATIHVSPSVSATAFPWKLVKIYMYIVAKRNHSRWMMTKGFVVRICVLYCTCVDNTEIVNLLSCTVSKYSFYNWQFIKLNTTWEIGPI